MKTFILFLLLVGSVFAQDDLIFPSLEDYLSIDSLSIVYDYVALNPYVKFFNENPYAKISKVQISFDNELWHYVFDCNANHLSGDDVRISQVLKIDSYDQYQWMIFELGECRASAIYMLYSASYWRALDAYGSIVMEGRARE